MYLLFTFKHVKKGNNGTLEVATKKIFYIFGNFVSFIYTKELIIAGIYRRFFSVSKNSDYM